VVSQEVVTIKIPVSAGSPCGSATCYVLLTASNANSVASTGGSFQQMVTINPSLYIAYESNDLGNIRFYSSNAPASSANELYSWCESGCNYSSGSAVFWVVLPTGISASSTAVINMTFNTVGTEYDGVYAGEAPQLSSSYGQYDNGQNVFLVYQNFAGSSAPSGWTLSNPLPCGPSTISFNNGVNEIATSCNGEHLDGPTTTGTLDMYTEWISAINGYGTGADFMGYTGLGALVGGFAAQSTNNIQAVASTESGGSQAWTGLFQPQSQWSVETTSFIGSGAFMIDAFQLNYGAVSYTNVGPSTGGTNFPITVDNYHGRVTANIQWIRVRVTPPGDVMPTVATGSLS
jgi:hypothetical protein